MNQNTLGITKPRTDDKRLWDILDGMTAASTLFVALDLKLFPLLAQQQRTLREICSTLNIVERSAQALLTACVALELIQVENSYYSLTQLSRDYLLPSSPVYFGDFVELQQMSAPLFAFESLKKAVLTNSAQVTYKGEDVFKSEELKAVPYPFIRGMHGHSIGPATIWPEFIDLSVHQHLLDIGGGSGAHAIAAALKWPDLKATVYDLKAILPAAQEYIAAYKLENRVSVQVGDMWNEPYPLADFHFYADIYHDWPPEKCRFLTRKSFESLPSGGRIVIHEVLYNDDKTGPFRAAAYNIAMLLTMEGQQYSGQELAAILTEAGFVEVEVKSTFGYWSIVTGCKP